MIVKQVDLIREILRRHAPIDPRAQALLRECDQVGFMCWTTRENVEFALELLVQELTLSGLDSESEPTERGLAIEDAIDWLREHSRLD
jgi:hypothetical protein